MTLFLLGGEFSSLIIGSFIGGVRLFIRLFVCSFVPLFICSFVHLFIRLFVRLFE